ncbi:uncharacterized protein sowahb isoform X8 [Xiphophorus couchianus]|uniref:uncharacterized protein sowahb isoform X8 n=1 Tax=Xiphophorus couchianus TaxID=32473 RepID=UPI001015E12F|nr:uncharacterized protein LOC114149623 isoform X8 [Xiphophorus couchianus]
MATDFTQDAVLVFLQRCGGSARNTELLAHFVSYLRENPDNVGNRDLFKSFVNSVATVSKIDGVSTVILRKKYRGYVSGDGSGRDSAEPGPVGASLSPAVSLAPPGDTERNPALPAAGIVVESGARLKYGENPSPEPVQVRNRVPELSEIPYQSKTEEQNRLVSAAGAPAVRHQDYIPEPIRWQEMPQESFIPASTRRQEGPHQDRFPEPIRGQGYGPNGGHVVNHQGYTPRPTGRHEVPQQDFPHMPSRRVDKPHQGTVPEPVRGHIVGRQDHAPDPGERWDPPNQETVSEPNKGRIVSRQDHVPEPIRGQKTSHQKRIAEPFRGHVGNRQDLFPGPVRGQQVLHQSPFPAPNRRWDAPHHDPRGYVISHVPEPNRGQNVFYQDPNRDPLRGSQPPTSQPPRGQQSFYQVPQNAEHLRGWEVPYQDPIPEYLSGQQVPQNLEPLRGQRIPYQIPQNPEPLGGQWIPYQVSQIPERFRGQEISYEDPVPEAFRGQNVYYQDPIPEYLSGHQVPQNLEPLRGQQVPQNLEPLRGQQVPQSQEPLKGQWNPKSPELHREHAKNPEPLQGQQVLQNLEPHKGQHISQSPELCKVHQKNLEPPKEQQVPKSPELHREQKISFLDLVPESDPGQQSPPQDPEPVGGPEPAPQLHQAPARRLRHRQSYRSAVSQDDDKEEEDVQIRRGSAGGPWPLNVPLSDVARAMSASSPCVIESQAPPSSSSGNKVPQIYIQNSDVEVPASRSHSESGSRPEPGPVPVESMRRSLPLEAEFNTERLHDKRAARTSEPIRPNQNQRLSSSQSDIFDPPSDVRSSVSDWPPSGSSRTQTGSGADEPAVSSTSLEVLQESNRTMLEPPARRSILKMSFHQSMGNLCDDDSPPSRKLYLSSDHLNDHQQYASRGSSLNQSTDELYDDMKSSKTSIDSPHVKLRSAAARRMSSRLRNRICRSLGTDLDQEEPGGGPEDARLERLHRISSSLSLPHHLSSSSLSSSTTPPRCPSPIASEGGRKESRKSLHSHNARQSAIPLEAQEHDWMVKAAAGAWPDVYALFRSDSSLLNRQDFISGFTVLHWMAKHGDHRVINTLSYGVEQKGLSFDVNAKSTAGQTPLHIAAMHGHKNVIRLLVKKLEADVKLRDVAGKKAWQYLSDRSPDILELLAAPPKAALTRGAENADPGLKPPKQQRNRLRHHFSSASSGQRPQTLAGMVKVNRSTSIAALLKPKPLQRF